jgi:hypothetical protein
MINKSSEYLVVKGVGGVGNRFISLMEAINYAKETNRILYLDWCDGMFGPTGVNIFFKYFNLKNIDYLESDKTIIEMIESGTTTFPKNLYSDDIKKPLLKNYYSCTPWLANYPYYKVGMGLVFKHKSSYLFGLQSFQRVGDKKGYFGVIRDLFKGDNFPLGGALSKKLKEKVVVFADFRPLCKLDNLFNYIELKGEHFSRYKEFSLENGFENVIGVHVRYTDKKPKSELDRLKKRLEIDLDQNPQYKIFLCSDNPDIISEFKTLFKGKIIFYEKFIPKVSEGAGIHRWAYRHFDEDKKEQLFDDCLADMWLLSMTKKLYWQGNSSFSLISKIIKKDAVNTFDWMKFN